MSLRLLGGLGIRAGLLIATAVSTFAADDILGTLRPEHPRLIVNATTWQNIHAQAETDALLGTVTNAIEVDARALLKKPPSTYHKTGRRLLDVSREVLHRTTVLAAAFHLTGDMAFAHRAEQEMLAAAGFADWNPSHFLDTAEMTAALALGYDWLFAELTPPTRQTIREAILAKGLRPALEPGAKFNSWQTAENNWNQVCFGGLILGALAIGDEEPATAGQMLTLARRQMAHGLQPYAPDGVYPEGPSYWAYGTSFSVLTFAALESALGTDWGMSKSPGFLASAAAFVQLNAPSGLFFNFSDSDESAGFEPTLFWFARRTGDAGLVAAQLRMLQPDAAGKLTHLRSVESSRFLPFAAVWWPQQRASPALPLRWRGEGANPVAVIRSSWTDPRALYLAVKGGSAALNHAHMDAGSFVFEVDGVRWARDLGKQDYESLESKGVDLWNRSQTSQRWTVFRLNNRSHNTLTIDNQLHRVTGTARIVQFSTNPGDENVRLDLSPVFAGQAQRVMRTFVVRRERELVVTDELAGLKPGADVRWAMVTAAQVTVADSQRAILHESGRELSLRLLSPDNARIDVIDAKPPVDSYNAPNPNRRIVEIHAQAGTTGEMSVQVSLNPDPSQ